MLRWIMRKLGYVRRHDHVGGGRFACDLLESLGFAGQAVTKWHLYGDFGSGDRRVYADVTILVGDVPHEFVRHVRTAYTVEEIARVSNMEPHDVGGV